MIWFTEMDYYSHRWLYAVGLALACLLTACGDNDSFRINGEIEGGAGDQRLTLVYYVRGAMQRLATQADNGRFIFEGESPSSTLGFIYMGNGMPLTPVVMKNGDDLSVKIPLDDPLSTSIKGNKTAQKLARWTSQNAEILRQNNTEAINRAVTRYVVDNPNDMSSAALIATRFVTPGYELLADSLISLVAVDVRPIAVMQNYNTVLATQLTGEAIGRLSSQTLYQRGDTLVRFMPRMRSYSLLAFVGPNSSGRDSIIPRLRYMSDSLDTRRFTLFEVSTAIDSAQWIRSTDRDSASWHQVWAPGAMASGLFRSLAVPRVPYFIVCDSTGMQIYRGSSITVAENTIFSYLKGS